MFVEDILDKAERIKNGQDNDHTARSRSAVACGIVGGLVGLMVGYSKKWKLFYSAIGGMAIGATVGHLFVAKTKKKS